MSLRRMIDEIDPTCACGEPIAVHQVPYLEASDGPVELRAHARKCSDCRPDHARRGIARFFAAGVP